MAHSLARFAFAGLAALSLLVVVPKPAKADDDLLRGAIVGAILGGTIAVIVDDRGRSRDRVVVRDRGPRFGYYAPHRRNFVYRYGDRGYYDRGRRFDDRFERRRFEQRVERRLDRFDRRLDRNERRDRRLDRRVDRFDDRREIRRERRSERIADRRQRSRWDD
ncbi:MAG: hypothetical protein AAF322_17445 [Pseudomonadota bacterium]